MSKIENKITRLADVVSSLKMTEKQKSYVQSLFNDVVDELNRIMVRYEKLTGNSIHDYDRLLSKTANILNAMFFTKIDLETDRFHDNFIAFIVKNKQGFRTKPNYDDLNKTRLLYEMYVIENDSEPETLQDLKNQLKELKND